MAEALIKYETIDEEQIKDIMAGSAPKPPEGWDETVDSRPRRSQPGTPIPAGQHRGDRSRLRPARNNSAALSAARCKAGV